jgi:hypothetical protein
LRGRTPWGSHVVVASDHYAPGTVTGDRLLAHVVQQRHAIDADKPSLRAAVVGALEQLRALYPGWRFSVTFGARQ